MTVLPARRIEGCRGRQLSRSSRRLVVSGWVVQIDRRTTRRKPLGSSPRRIGGCAWLQPEVSLHCQVVPPVRACLVGHLAPCQLNTVWRFRDKEFSRVKAGTYFRRGALRLSQDAFAVTLGWRCTQRTVGPCRPFRR